MTARSSHRLFWRRTVTVEGTITEQEFVRLNRWLFYRKPVIAILHLAIFGLGLFWSMRAGGEGGRGVLAWSPLLIAVVLFFMISHKSRLQYRKNQTLQSAVTYTLTEEGLVLESRNVRAPLPWEQITEIQTTPGHIVIYGSRGQAFVVAKAWFEGPEASRAFVDALEQGMGRRAPTGRA